MVERNLAKVEVAGPSPVFRSKRLKIKQLGLPKAILEGFFVTINNLFVTESATGHPETKTSHKKQRKCMSYTTFNVSFYCRDSKANSKGLAPIELSVIINGERAIITLPRKETPKTFKAAVSAKRNKNICEIDKPLHTHIARHSYATRCINEGVRIEVVAKLLGHATTRITSHYARLIQKNIVSEVQEAFNLNPKGSEGPTGKDSRSSADDFVTGNE